MRLYCAFGGEGSSPYSSARLQRMHTKLDFNVSSRAYRIWDGTCEAVAVQVDELCGDPPAHSVRKSACELVVIGLQSSRVSFAPHTYYFERGCYYKDITETDSTQTLPAITSPYPPKPLQKPPWLACTPKGLYDKTRF